MLLWHVLLGEFCQLHQLWDQLLGVITVGTVHQRRSHGIQDSLVTCLHRKIKDYVRVRRTQQENRSLWTAIMVVCTS